MTRVVRWPSNFTFQRTMGSRCSPLAAERGISRTHGGTRAVAGCQSPSRGWHRRTRNQLGEVRAVGVRLHSGVGSRVPDSS
jgi:hypothetical protein